MPTVLERQNMELCMLISTFNHHYAWEITQILGCMAENQSGGNPKATTHSLALAPNNNKQ